MTSNRSWLLFLPLLLAAGGCSVIVGNELDSKNDGGAADSGACDPSAVDECTVDGDCPSARMACSVDACGVGVCTCPLLFVRGAGMVDGGPAEDCYWQGFIDDPGFEVGIPPWAKTGDATVDPTASGNLDPGAASFNTYAFCNGDTVLQGVSVPSRAALDPSVVDHGLALEVTYRGTATGGIGGEPSPQPVISIGSGSVVLPASTSGWATQRACLGASVYDQSMDLVLSTTAPYADCGGSIAYSLDVDRLEVVPPLPDECPPLGGMLNANMESDIGWNLSCYAANGAAKACAYSAGTGASGSRSIYLMTTLGCSGVTATGQLSLPLASEVANMAVEFWVNGTNGDSMSVSIGGVGLPAVVGTGSGTLVRRCVPTQFFGQVQPLTFTWTTSNTCANDGSQAFYIDNVQVVSDVGCAP